MNTKIVLHVKQEQSYQILQIKKESHSSLVIGAWNDKTKTVNGQNVNMDESVIYVKSAKAARFVNMSVGVHGVKSVVVVKYVNMSVGVHGVKSAEVLKYANMSEGILSAENAQTLFKL